MEDLLGRILAKDIPKFNQVFKSNYEFAKHIEIRGTYFKKQKQKQKLHGNATRKIPL